MPMKIVYLFLAFVLASEVSCRYVDQEESQAKNAVTEVRLDDMVINHITNPLISTSISIPHLILDTLEMCAVTFPNGITYEVFPNSNLPTNVIPHTSVFPACSVGFRDIPVSMSGTYELLALKSHWDGRRTLQRQRFILNICESAPCFLE